MKCEIIKTGSAGNCIVLNDIIALDIGVSYKKVLPYLKNLKLVFCSHKHGDHFKPSTIRKVALERPNLRFCGSEWLKDEFISCGILRQNIDVLKEGNRYDYGLFQIEPFALFHDVPNYGLKIYMSGEKSIYIIDTGYIDHIQAKNFDLYLIESNYMENEIIKRIEEKQESESLIYEYRAWKYHLSYEQAISWIKENAKIGNKYVLLHGHKKDGE